MKITRYRDIPQFIRAGSYEVDISVDYINTTLGEWVSELGLDLNPDFQRGHKWTEKQQIAYIEYFLRGGITARVIYFNKPDWHFPVRSGYNDFVLVDGKQRLEAWRRFLADEIVVFGSKHSDFTDRIRIVNSLRFNVNSLQTKAEVLQWYLDFNSGGVVHTAGELNRVRKMLDKLKQNSEDKK